MVDVDFCEGPLVPLPLTQHHPWGSCCDIPHGRPPNLCLASEGTAQHGVLLTHSFLRSSDGVGM